MSNGFGKIAFVANPTATAQQRLQELIGRYGNAELEQADVIVAIGGDGFMLKTLHDQIDRKTPIFGMMAGSIGFLMNRHDERADLLSRLNNAVLSELHPLQMIAKDTDGHRVTALAINEVSLLRQTRQAAKIRVSVNDNVKLDELICDGILLSTAAGSTAYNLSAHGPILPLGANLLALTPISPFRPRRWRGALLSCDWRVSFDVIKPETRLVSATADFVEVRDVVRVEIAEDRTRSLRLLHDPDHNLEDRILNEQFAS